MKNDIWEKLYHEAKKGSKCQSYISLYRSGWCCSGYFDKDSGDIEILMDYETRKIVRLRELIPEWWGKNRFV